jgi:hypothetical protein
MFDKPKASRSSKSTLVVSPLDTSLEVVAADRQHCRLGTYSLLRHPATGKTFLRVEKLLDSDEEFRKATEEVTQQIALKSQFVLSPVDFSASVQSAICSTFFRLVIYYPAFETDLATHCRQLAQSTSSQSLSANSSACLRFLMGLIYRIGLGMADLEAKGLGLLDVSPDNIVMMSDGSCRLLTPSITRQSPRTLPKSILQSLLRKQPIYVSEAVYRCVQRPLPSDLDTSKANLFALGLLALECGLGSSIQKIYGANLAFKGEAFLDYLKSFYERYHSHSVLMGLMAKMLERDETRRSSLSQFLRRLPPFETALSASPVKMEPKAVPSSRFGEGGSIGSEKLRKERIFSTESSRKAVNNPSLQTQTATSKSPKPAFATQATPITDVQDKPMNSDSLRFTFSPDLEEGSQLNQKDVSSASCNSLKPPQAFQTFEAKVAEPSRYHNSQSPAFSKPHATPIQPALITRKPLFAKPPVLPPANPPGSNPNQSTSFPETPLQDRTPRYLPNGRVVSVYPRPPENSSSFNHFPNGLHSSEKQEVVTPSFEKTLSINVSSKPSIGGFHPLGNQSLPAQPPSNPLVVRHQNSSGDPNLYIFKSEHLTGKTSYSDGQLLREIEQTDEVVQPNGHRYLRITRKMVPGVPDRRITQQTRHNVSLNYSANQSSLSHASFHTDLRRHVLVTAPTSLRTTPTLLRRF